MKRKLLVGFGLAVALFGVAGCSDGGASDSGTSSESNEGQLGLGNLPDVVAEVNGHEITKDEFVDM